MDVRGKVVLLTGASAGIGLVTAHMLAAQGARLALVARSEEKLRSLAAELAGSIALPADVSNLAQARGAVSRALKHFGRVGTSSSTMPARAMTSR